MDPDSVQYLDQQGWRTQDYSMDPSDVARLRAGVDISGAPKDPTLYPLDSYINNPAAPTVWNRTRAQVPPVVTSQPAATTSIPGVSLSGNPQIDAFNAVNNARGALTMAQNPLDYTNGTTLAGTQRQRASTVVGGTDLLNNLTGGTGGPLVVNQDGTIASDVAGSKKGSTGLATSLISDPRFRTLMAMNPDNAKRFYTAITGRDHDTDLAASQALMATQNTNQLKLGQDVAEKAMPASKDQPDLGIKKGDIVKQVVQPGLIPGTVAVGEAPLTDAESKAYGIVKNPVTGATSYVPGSFAHKALGINTIGDDRTKISTDLARQAELLAKSRAGSGGSGKSVNPTLGTQQLTTAEQSAQDTDAGMAGAVNSFGDAAVSTLRGIQNFGNGLQGIGNKVINYFGGSKAALGTPTFYNNNDAYLNQGSVPTPADAANTNRLAALRAAGFDI